MPDLDKIASDPIQPSPIQLGNLKLTLVDDGPFGLDGGAMFGVVPKTLWSRKKAADEHNRIRMTTNSLLVERGDDLLLIETGLGEKLDEKARKIFAMADDAVRLPQQIEAAGYALEDVTHVLLTHLHFDHCGWNTRLQGDEWVPTFPNATYFIAQGEIEHGEEPNVRDRSSYDSRNWEPLFLAGQIELFDDEVEVIPGVRAVKTPGHNEDMCIVLLDGGAGEKGAFWADLVPTAAHVPVSWTMGFDLYPLRTMANKEKWLPKAAAEDWLCFFVHDPDVPAGRLREDERGRLQVEPV